MKPEDVTRVQTSLSAAIGRRVSDGDLGDAMGLAPKSAKDSVRRWKSDGPTGPAALALSYIDQGLPLGDFAAKTPEYVIGPTLEDEEATYIVRLQFPRFVAVVAGAETVTASANIKDWFAVSSDLYMGVVQWIDDIELAAFTNADRKSLVRDMAVEIWAELERRSR